MLRENITFALLLTLNTGRLLIGHERAFCPKELTANELLVATQLSHKDGCRLVHAWHSRCTVACILHNNSSVTGESIKAMFSYHVFSCPGVSVATGAIQRFECSHIV